MIASICLYWFITETTVVDDQKMPLDFEVFEKFDCIKSGRNSFGLNDDDDVGTIIVYRRVLCNQLTHALRSLQSVRQMR